MSAGLELCRIVESKKNSTLSKALRRQLENTPYHLLADTAYPLGERILFPFKNNLALEDV